MVKEKLLSVAEGLYIVHLELLGIGVQGKDCERFISTLNKIAELQLRLRTIAEEEGNEDGGNIK